MAFTTNLLATMNAVKVGYVSHFFSYSFGIRNEYLGRRLSQTTTRRVQTSCCYRGTSLKAVAPFMMSQTETRSDSDGIGIGRFLKGKSYFVTGATGFLAKVLIEKLLRESPEIGKIFLLMKSNDQESANKRLYDEIISSDLFKLLKQMHGSSYEDLMKSTLIPVIGDIGEDNLGMDSETAAKISEEIDVIISCGGRTTFDDRYDLALNINALGPDRLLSFGKECKELKLFLHFSTDIGEENLGMDSEAAAKISEEIDVIISCGGRTTFDDRYDLALNINALGPDRLLSFGKECKELKLFLHFSTAYVTGKKEGVVLETPLCIGENITSDLNMESELKLASEAVRMFHGSEETNKLKELGIERAQLYGWENTYTFTKAIGESVIHSKRGDLPVVIIRPSIIESSYKEPFPGWIQGFRMADPIILAYGKGLISEFWGDSQSLMDIVPVDMVVNATIAAMAKHCSGVPELKVYNVNSSSHANPMLAGELMDLSYQHLCDSPLTETVKDLEPMKFHSSIDGFISSLSNTIAKHERVITNEGGGDSKTTMSMKGKRMLNYFVSLVKTYEPYTFFQARFDDTNTRSLIHELSMEERKMFDFDVEGIDWEHYIVNVHLPGLKRQFFRGRFS